MLGITIRPFYKIGTNWAALAPSGAVVAAIFMEDGYTYIYVGEHAGFETPIKYGSVLTRGKAIGRALAMN